MAEDKERRNIRGKELLDPGEQHQFDVYADYLMGMAGILEKDPDIIFQSKDIQIICLRAERLGEIVERMDYSLEDLSPFLRKALSTLNIEHFFPQPQVVSERPDNVKKVTIVETTDKQRIYLDSLLTSVVSLFASGKKTKNLPHLCYEIVRLCETRGGVENYLGAGQAKLVDFILAHKSSQKDVPEDLQDVAGDGEGDIISFEAEGDVDYLIDESGVSVVPGHEGERLVEADEEIGLTWLQKFGRGIKGLFRKK